jgi:poly(3-hydroxybutyrate) depolymerase
VLVAALITVTVGVVGGGTAESTAAPSGTLLRPDPLIPRVPDAARPLVVVPAGPVRDTLVIALHGYTGGPEQMRQQLDGDAWARELGATVVYPTGLGHRTSWNAGGCCGSAARSGIDDVGFIARTITRFRDAGARQVFLVGYSNGGMLAYRVACERPDLVDAIAVVNGTITVGTCEGAFEALHLAGELDTAVPIQGADVVPYLFTGFRPLVDLPKLAPTASLDVRVLPGVGHEIAPEAHEIITDWLRERLS